MRGSSPATYQGRRSKARTSCSPERAHAWQWWCGAGVHGRDACAAQLVVVGFWFTLRSSAARHDHRSIEAPRTTGGEINDMLQRTSERRPDSACLVCGSGGGDLSV